MDLPVRRLAAAALLVALLAAGGSYAGLYDRQWARHAEMVGLEAVADGDVPADAEVTALRSLPPETRATVRRAWSDEYGSATLYTDDGDHPASDALTALRYVRVDGQTYRVMQVADENMSVFGDVFAPLPLVASLTAAGLAAAWLWLGRFRPLDPAAATLVPVTALTVDTAVWLLDPTWLFGGDADLPVVPAAPALVVVGVALARGRLSWAVAAAAGFVALDVAARTAGSEFAGVPAFVLAGLPCLAVGYLFGRGEVDLDGRSTDRFEVAP
jgi:hypothetical protein